MARKAYILSFDRDDTLDYVALHSSITSLPEVLNWSHYIKSSYILISDLQTATELNKKLLPLMPQKRFILLEVNLQNRNGWLPQDAWEWMKKQVQKMS